MNPTGESTGLRDFLEIPYDKLEEMNLEAKQQRIDRVPLERVQSDRLKYLQTEKRVKAVTVCFSDLEGRLHMLDYDKKFLLKSYDNLTFDGSSIRGFSAANRRPASRCPGADRSRPVARSRGSGCRRRSGCRGS